MVPETNLKQFVQFSLHSSSLDSTHPLWIGTKRPLKLRWSNIDVGFIQRLLLLCWMVYTLVNCCTLFVP